MDEKDPRIDDFRDKGGFSPDEFKTEEELLSAEKETRHEELLLGQLAIKNRIIDSDQLAECLTHQKEHGGRLGEIMLAKKYISEADLADLLLVQRQQVNDRLEEEHKTPMLCRKCGAAFHVQGYEFGKVYRCPECKGVLMRQSNPQTIMGYKSKKIPETDTTVPEEIKGALSGENEFFGKYMLLKRVGAGGGGTVYRAFDVELERIVALKLFTAASQIDLERTRVEAQLAAKMEHSGIPRVYEAGAVEGVHFISMQFIDGRPVGDKEMSLLEALRVVREAAHILYYANTQGIIHRDIKPSNIMIDAQGKIWLMDFGIAKMTTNDPQKALTQTGDIMGTPQFMSPEQAQGLHKELDARTDVFSLGATMYFLLTGTYPFTGPNFVEVLRAVQSVDPTPVGTLAAGIPKDVEAIVGKSMEKEKERRYRSAKDFGDDIDRYLSGEPVTAKPVGFFGRAARKIRRHRKAAAISAAVGILLISAAAIGIFQYVKRKDVEGRTHDLISLFLSSIKNKYAEALAMRRAGEGYETLSKIAASAEEDYKNLKAKMNDVSIEDANVECALGRLHRMVGNDSRALEFQRTALALDANSAAANYELGILFYRDYLARIAKTKDDWIFTQSGRMFSRGSNQSAGWTEPTEEQLLKFSGSANLSTLRQESRQRLECIPQNSAEYTTASAILLMLDGKKSEAAKIFAQTSRTDADAALFLSSILAGPPQNLREAIRVLDEAISGDRGNTVLLSERAKAYTSLAEIEFANGKDPAQSCSHSINDWLAVTRLHPGGDAAWVKLAEAHSAFGMSKKSRGEDPTAEFESAHKALEKAATNYETLLWSGTLFLNEALYLQENGRDAAPYYARTLESLDAATKLNSKRFEAWAVKAQASINQGLAKQTAGKDPTANYKTALEMLDRALAVNANSYDSWLSRARVYGNLAYFHQLNKQSPDANYDSAIKAVDGAIVAAAKGGASGGVPINTYLAWSARGKIFTNWGLQKQMSGQDPAEKYREALQSFERALALNPNDHDSISARGGLWVNWGNYKRNSDLNATAEYDNARKDFERALDLNSASCETWMKLGVLLAATGDVSKAAACFEKATQLNSKNTDAWLRRGRAYAALGDFDTAAASYAEVLKQNPDNVNALQFLGEALSDKGAFFEGKNEFSRAAEAYDGAADAFERGSKADAATTNAMALLAKAARERAGECRSKARE